jgi:hypothetical protein
MTREIILLPIKRFYLPFKLKLKVSWLFSLFIFSLPQSFAYQSTNESDWKISKESNVTSVEYRNILNSDLIEIKAKTSIDSTLSGFLLFMQDTKNIALWLDNATESKIIKKIDKTKSILQTKFSGFWLVANRIMIIESHYWQNPDLSIEITSKNTKSNEMLDSKEILIDVISANWMIKPTSKNKIEVNYQFIVDAKGDLPHWLVNSMALKSTWKTLENLRKQLPLSAWQAKALSNIKEFVNNSPKD